MQRTLKEAIGSPQADRRAQQRAFNQLRREYNEVRPHQALGMQTPAAVYRSSPREFSVRCSPAGIRHCHAGAADTEARRIQGEACRRVPVAPPALRPWSGFMVRYCPDVLSFAISTSG